MAIYIDEPVWPAKTPSPGRDASGDAGAESPAHALSESAPAQAPSARGRLWSHLISDVSYAELHVFAELLGAPRRGFERDHYDVPAELHAVAVALGARQVSSRVIVELLHTAGLRRRKPRRPL